jgi:hypothetical protein
MLVFLTFLNIFKEQILSDYHSLVWKRAAKLQPLFKPPNVFSFFFRKIFSLGFWDKLSPQKNGRQKYYLLSNYQIYFGFFLNGVLNSDCVASLLKNFGAAKVQPF